MTLPRNPWPFAFWKWMLHLRSSSHLLLFPKYWLHSHFSASTTFPASSLHLIAHDNSKPNNRNLADSKDSENDRPLKAFLPPQIHAIPPFWKIHLTLNKSFFWQLSPYTSSLHFWLKHYLSFLHSFVTSMIMQLQIALVKLSSLNLFYIFGILIVTSVKLRSSILLLKWLPIQRNITQQPKTISVPNPWLCLS